MNNDNQPSLIEKKLRHVLGWSCKHMDEFIDSLLVEELVCDIALPHLPKRIKLEQLGILDERTSILDAELLNAEEDAVIVAYNKKIATQIKDGNDLKFPEPEISSSAKKSDDKNKHSEESSLGNGEYISEYRKDDARSRQAAVCNDDDDSRKDVEELGGKRREDSADRGRGRRGSSRDKYGPGSGRNREDRRDSGSNRRDKYVPLRRSGSRNKDGRRDREHRSKRDDSRSRSRTRDRLRDRDDRDRGRERDHRSRDFSGRDRHDKDRGRDRARSNSYDSRSQSRSRSPISKHSKQSYKSSPKRHHQESERDRRRERNRSKSDSRRNNPSSRRSRGSRYRSASSASEDVKRKSKKQIRSPSSSRSRSPSESSSSSESEKDSVSKGDSSSASKMDSVSKGDSSSASKRDENIILKDVEENAEALISVAEEKAAALKASKAEKKFDKIFKTKKSDGGKESQGSSGAGVKAYPEGSVEYWNQIREGLGIKKLKS